MDKRFGFKGAAVHFVVGIAILDLRPVCSISCFHVQDFPTADLQEKGLARSVREKDIDAWCLTQFAEAAWLY
jgi:hypothetical protein